MNTTRQLILSLITAILVVSSCFAETTPNIYNPTDGSMIGPRTASCNVAGDLTGDCIVDDNDIAVIRFNKVKPLSACPECDIDGDGRITVLDARKLALMSASLPTANFSAAQAEILQGGSATLTWQTQNAQKAVIDNGIGEVALSGSVSVSPQQTTTYTITVTGNNGAGTTSQVTVTVLVPSAAFNTDPPEILQYGSATLTWDVRNVRKAFIDNGIGEVSLSGSRVVSPQQTTTYTITGTNDNGSVIVTAQTTVTVTGGAGSVTANITASSTPNNKPGDPVTLTWNTANAASVFLDDGNTTVSLPSLSGSQTVTLQHTTVYTLTAIGNNGAAARQITIMVRGTPAPLPDGSFGKQYEDLIPQDASVQSYDSKRFSVITGLVLNAGGSPLGGVSVTVHGHPEYGTAFTDDTKGRFSIPVEGGSDITLIYRKAGLLTSQRKVYVPWNDIAVAETLRMIAEDTAATKITFDGNPNTVITHRSTAYTDSFGTRSATMIFTGDNQAYIADKNGNTLGQLGSITVRASEYTTQDSMPAKLPPNSAYTYCTELGADSVQRIKFGKPVIVLVDNFLKFPVGSKVPVGYYDRDRGVWVPANNGIIVQLPPLNSSGTYDDPEYRGLDPAIYKPNSTYMRFQTDHFTPWDCNWPYGPPDDATDPNPDNDPYTDEQCDDCETATGSFTEDRSRIFHEDIPIPGTDMRLHYASNRVKGYRHVITVPISGSTIPASLKEIIVIVRVAGRAFEQHLTALSNQKAEIVWDGLDYQGKSVSGTIIAHTDIGFVYDAVYYGPGNFAQAFAQAGVSVTADRARQEVILWKYSQSSLYITPKTDIAEGWTLSVAHKISDPANPPVLFKGDGSIINDFNAIKPIKSVVGNGTRGNPQEGDLATKTKLDYPCTIKVSSSGELHFINGNRVWKVRSDGIVAAVAGNGSPENTFNEGVPASTTGIEPRDIAFDNQGNLFIACKFGIRKVDKAGIITTVFRRYEVLNIATDNYGNLYVVDASDIHSISYSYYYYSNATVWKLDTGGNFTKIAGTGINGYSQDGSFASGSQLGFIWDIETDNQGNLYILEYCTSCIGGEMQIRKVDTSGILTTIAGTRLSYRPPGDGGPATDAALYAAAIALDNVGNVYTAEGIRLRKINTLGIIDTIASYRGGLVGAKGVATDAAGVIYIADADDNRIKKIGDYSTAFCVLENCKLFYEKSGIGHKLVSGRHESTIDLNTGLVLRSFGYDSSKRLISIKDQFNNEVVITRNPSGVPVSVKSPDGLTTGLTIDDNNQLIQITYPNPSEVYRFSYSPNNDGLLTKKTEPNGNEFAHVFSETGRLTAATDQAGGHWNFTKTGDAGGNIRSEVITGEGNKTTYLDRTDSTGAYTSKITDAAGLQTTFSKSSDGLTVSKILPCGTTMGFRYDPDPMYNFEYLKEITESVTSGLTRTTQFARLYTNKDADGVPKLITETTTINGKTFTVADDITAHTKTMTSPAGIKVISEYNPATLLTTKIQVPGLSDTEFGYDEKGRRTSVTTGSRATVFTYRTDGNMGSITSDNRTTIFDDYDAVGRIKKMTRPDLSELSFAYDADGNMTVLTTPRPANHGFGYNKVNLPSSYTTPMSGSYSYLYDKDRRLKQINFPSGRQIKNIYANGRLTQIQTPEGDADIVYNCADIGSISKGGESVSYGYNGSLLISETVSGTLSGTLSYAYNNDFAVSSFTYAGGSAAYGYDNDGLLTGAGRFTISRNALNGLPETVESGGSVFLSRSFNGYGETDSETYTVGSQNVFRNRIDTRGNTGRIMTKTETVGGTAAVYAYSYDAMGRLLTVTKNGTLIEEYRYDSAGTRVYEKKGNAAAETLSYDADDGLLTAGTTTYQHDADGFLKTKTEGTGITAYDYSSRGELRSVTLPDTRIIEYVHDPLGRRIAKKINGTIVEKYLWQGMTRLLAVYDGNNALVMRFEYADARMPFAMTMGSTTYFLTYDQVGSLRTVVNTSGTVIKQIDYDSFGNILNDTDPSLKIPFGFAGGLHDRDTGLVRFGYRDYDPDTGRWTAKDPIGFGGGDTDLYGYCVNDPVNRMDPSGKLGHIAIGAIAGAVGGLITGIAGGGDSTAIVSSVIAGAVAGAITAAIIAGPIVAGILNSSMGATGTIAALAATNGVSAGAASAVGQVAGNAILNGIDYLSGDPCVKMRPIKQNFSWGAVAGAAIGGASTFTSVVFAGETGTAAGIAQAFAEGGVIGVSEAAGGSSF